MLSLVELEEAAAAVTELLAGHRVQAIVQPDAERIVLEVYGRDASGEARRLTPADLAAWLRGFRTS